MTRATAVTRALIGAVPFVIHHAPAYAVKPTDCGRWEESLVTWVDWGTPIAVGVSAVLVILLSRLLRNTWLQAATKRFVGLVAGLTLSLVALWVVPTWFPGWVPGVSPDYPHCMDYSYRSPGLLWGTIGAPDDTAPGSQPHGTPAGVTGGSSQGKPVHSQSMPLLALALFAAALGAAIGWSVEELRTVRWRKTDVQRPGGRLE